MKYEVIAGNIGMVYSGTSRTAALQAFKAYANDSANDYGRVAGESVTLLANDDILREYIGTIDREEGNQS